MVFNRLSDFVKLLTQNKKRKKKRNVSFQNIPFGQFFLLLLFIVVISILIYIQIILDSDKIYANIFIDGYHVGGLERSEALKLIKENMDTSYLEDYLALYTAESEYELYFRDIDYLPDYDNAINLAYKIGRNGSNIQRLCEIWDVYRTGLQITPTMCYNVEKVASLLHNICNEINKKAINAEIKVNKGIITISPHVVGRILDVNSTLNRIKTALVNKQWNDVELCVLEITPDVTTEMVENITYKLAEFSTAFNPNNEARTHNIRNACKKIDQSLLLPQQEFIECSVRQNIGNTWYFDISAIDPDGDLVSCNAVIDGIDSFEYSDSAFRGQVLRFHHEKKQFIGQSFLMTEEKNPFTITFILTDTYGNIDIKTIMLQAATPESSPTEISTESSIGAEIDKEQQIEEQKSLPVNQTAQDIETDIEHKANVLHMEEETVPMLKTGVTIVLLCCFGTVLYLYIKSRKNGYILFFLQLIFLYLAFSRVLSILTMKIVNTTMLSENVSLNIGLSALYWAISMGCMIIGIMMISKKGEG
jgi:hypothetical protein